ncbi:MULTISPECIES: ribosome small subunit-dependent GTPase A [Dyadobacter]|uniref:Small ribosomal subunit biogenesis GTPase RsgA n=1 Tax=Dyadobacter chenhuakuii TaxID=2909339 RepID=A0ABY4XJ16_9BACT|nr:MULTISPECIES: ribosome small subunit-dependent GTPase A [Dyadobacter]MCE7071811.1 ribosome small subunit-dependent GTPase A [Dyadobacter sp. CY327]MCF2496359.1 ribosome small subunit-dependent GTPase A [Dyadobacter chenhuakuii]MCF2519474.1 ribosome small subunit-dependent GTPase A [Dyadobacter sp. CY351]USJ30419.1 ribosome small subunit-dependent GTPase A [Dyadobacter chenhuakuii]
MELVKGLVLRSTGSWYDVRDSRDGHIWQCRLKGKFKALGLKVTNPIAVGDNVRFEEEDETQNFGIIHEIMPRENYVVRRSVHKTAHAHLIAANVDQAILIATLVFPRTSLGFIDRFLVAIESFRIPGVLIFNKQDLLNDDMKEFQAELMELYESLGYTCMATTAVSEEGLEEFAALLGGKVSLLSGHSGVGKSTLVNAIAPDLDIKTQEVSTFANKGVHTTTFAEMFELEPGTFIIDSPGIKELGLSDMKAEEISHYFPEMRELLNQCRFNNCQHINEPGCAVKDAVSEGRIAISRYESYLSMVGGQDNRK